MKPWPSHDELGTMSADEQAEAVAWAIACSPDEAAIIGVNCARDGIRTRMEFPPEGFKPSASAVPPPGRWER